VYDGALGGIAGEPKIRNWSWIRHIFGGLPILAKLTKMVNNPNPRILVAGRCIVRTTSRGRRIITNGPVYDLTIAQQLLRVHGLHVVNERADTDMITRFYPALTPASLSPIILTLTSNHYVGSEICATGVNMELHADAFTICWNQQRCAESKVSGRETYLKFGFRENNPKCLIVSIHPS